jgi:hypothetical protein
LPVLLQVATAALRYVQCVQIGPYSRVYTSPAINCHEDKYARWFGVITALLVLDVVLCPLGILALLLYNKQRLFPVADNTFAMKFGVLYEQYTPASFFWGEFSVLPVASCDVAQIALAVLHAMILQKCLSNVPILSLLLQMKLEFT